MSAYALNKFLYELRGEDARAAFARDADAAMARYDLSSDERALVHARAWNELLSNGVSIYILANLARAADVPMSRMGAEMRGETPEQTGAFLAQQSARVAPFALIPGEGSDG